MIVTYFPKMLDVHIRSFLGLPVNRVKVDSRPQRFWSPGRTEAGFDGDFTDAERIHGAFTALLLFRA